MLFCLFTFLSLFFCVDFPKKSSHSSMYNLFVFFQFWHDLHVFPLGLPTFLHFSLDFLVFLSRSFQGERAQMMNRCMNQKRTNETPMMFFPVCFWLFVNLFVRDFEFALFVLDSVALVFRGVVYFFLCFPYFFILWVRYSLSWFCVV